MTLGTLTAARVQDGLLEHIRIGVPNPVPVDQLFARLKDHYDVRLALAIQRNARQTAPGPYGSGSSASCCGFHGSWPVPSYVVRVAAPVRSDASSCWPPPAWRVGEPPGESHTEG
jgi:hypothetical protein